jgi:hypothetical protein
MNTDEHRFLEHEKTANGRESDFAAYFAKVTKTNKATTDRWTRMPRNFGGLVANGNRCLTNPGGMARS